MQKCRQITQKFCQYRHPANIFVFHHLWSLYISSPDTKLIMPQILLQANKPIISSKKSFLGVVYIEIIMRYNAVQYKDQIIPVTGGRCFCTLAPAALVFSKPPWLHVTAGITGLNLICLLMSTFSGLCHWPIIITHFGMVRMISNV